MERLRVIQIGLGPIGREIAALVRTSDRYDLVGAADPSSDLVGRDLGEILRVGFIGVEVRPEPVRVVEDLKPDLAFHATGSYLSDEAGHFQAILDRGVSVVSTCEELAYPFYRHPEISRDLDAAASRSGAVLLGAGVNPGFALDRLVATLAGACARIERIRATRVVDVATRRAPLQRKVGAGLTVEDFEARVRSGRFGHAGLRESAHMVGDAIGVSDHRKVSETIAPRVATRALRTEHVVIEPGRVAGLRQVAVVEENGRERVLLELEMYVGAEPSVDTVSIEGDPPIEMRIPGGIPGDRATATVIHNCGLVLARLDPGLRTVLDLPPRL